MKDYFFEFIKDLDTNKQTENQVKFILELKKRRENLIILEERSLCDYLNLELDKFIPFPK